MDERGPVVVYRTLDRSGATYSLAPGSRRLLERELGRTLRLGSRVFLSRDTQADYQAFHGDLAQQICMLLTGLSLDQLEPYGGVQFRDPESGRDIPDISDLSAA